MSIFKQRFSKKAKVQIAITSAVVLAICTLLTIDIVGHGPLSSFLSNRERLIATVESFGIFAPIIYILLQILQTVAAPIPGQIVGIMGGILFGWWGIIWTIIGSGIGFFIVFTLSRKFGRPLVEKLVKKSYLDKFDFISGKHAPLILFSIFVIPGFPDDIVCYIAGLTEIPIKQLMAMIIIGRLPAVFMSNIFGDSIGKGNHTALIIISVVSVLMIAIAATFNKKIMAFFKKLQDKEDIENGD